MRVPTRVAPLFLLFAISATFAIAEDADESDAVAPASVFDVFDSFGSVDFGRDESPNDLDTSDSFGDLDSLFEGDMVEVVETIDTGAAPGSELLTSESVEWGGRLRGDVTSEFGWNTLWTPEFDVLTPPNQALSPSISGDLFFDARPNPEFRAFGKIKLQSAADGGAGLAGTINNAALAGDLPEGWSREEDENGDTVIRDDSGDVIFTVAVEPAGEAEPSTGTAPAVDLSVYELFSDFSYADRLFFRFGKHTIQWGVGYFFSPADVLNLSAVNAQDPTADREGPVSLRAQFPFGLHNAYLYIITNVGAKPLDIAIAPKLEYVIGATELTAAFYYQQALAPRAIAMFSSSVGDVEFFGEAVVSLGSDRVFVRESDLSIDDIVDPPAGLSTILYTYMIDRAPIFFGTVGLRWLKDVENAGSLAILGQYLFNGDGYGDSDLLEASAFLLQNPDTNGFAVADAAAQPEGYAPPPDLVASDLANWGRHYAAVSANWSSIADTGISVSLFGLVNLSDLSGVVSPSVNFRFLDTFSASVSGRITFGDPGDELTDPAGLFSIDDAPGLGTLAITVSIGLGGGSF